MKIIFITNIPFIRQHRIDMYVDSIAECYDVAMWDLSVAYGNGDVVKEKEQESILISSISEFSSKLREEKGKDDVVIVTGILISNLKKIYNIIKGLDIPIVSINKEAFAAWLGNKGYMSQIWNGSFKSFVKAILFYNSFSRRLHNAIFNRGIKYDYLLASYNFNPEESIKFIRIHHLKYDEFLAANNQPSVVEGEYILFVDAALADHPMYANHPNKVNRETYLRQLNDYFDKLEDCYHMKVVISAHPKSMYLKNDFRGREIIMYKTPVLVRHSTYIVSHFSTSLIDAVLHNKPMKIMYSPDLMKSTCRYSTAMGLQLAKMLNCETVNLDSPTITDFYIDSKAYEKFREKYVINREQQQLTNKEQINLFLKKLQNKLQNKR